MTLSRKSATVPLGTTYQIIKTVYVNKIATASDISSELHIKSKEVFPYLKRWIKKGIIVSEKIGNKRTYRFNQKHPAAEILSFIFENDRKLVNGSNVNKQKLIEAITKKFRSLSPHEITILAELIDFAREHSKNKVDLIEFYQRRIAIEKRLLSLLPAKLQTLFTYIANIRHKIRHINITHNECYIDRSLLFIV